MKVIVSHNAAETLAAMRRIAADQVPFAMSLAVNRVAQQLKSEQSVEMTRVFDRPTPWTMNSVFMKPGTKRNPEALVWLKDERAVSTGHPAAKYLMPQIRGGARGMKGFEGLLTRAGILPAGWHVVPGERAKIDAYGNLARSEITRVLSWLQAFPRGQGYDMNATPETMARRRRGTRRARGHEYFVAYAGDPYASPTKKRSAWKHGKKRQHLQPGIYRKTFFAFGSGIQPIMIFVDGTRYQRRYDFFGVGERVVQRQMVPELRRAFVEARRSAR